jgi:hypothetical protein
MWKIRRPVFNFDYLGFELHRSPHHLQGLQPYPLKNFRHYSAHRHSLCHKSAIKNSLTCSAKNDIFAPHSEMQH